MFKNLEVFQLADRMAQHAGQRQALIAQNVANSDTPGFVARDLTPFSQIVSQSPASIQRATRAKHMHGGDNIAQAAKVLSDRTHPSPDGNTVGIEREMLKSVNTMRQHSRAISIYKSSLSILRTTLGRQ